MNNLVFLFLVIAVSMMFCYVIMSGQENRSVITPDPQSTHPLAGRKHGAIPLFTFDYSDIMKRRKLYGGFGNAGQPAMGAAGTL